MRFSVLALGLVLLPLAYAEHAPPSGMEGYCAPGCDSTPGEQSMIGNGKCDFACLTASCGYDGLECYMFGTQSSFDANNIVSTLDQNGDMLLNFTELQPALGNELPPWTLDELSVYNKDGLSSYDLFHKFFISAIDCVSMHEPASTNDWSTWAGSSGIFLVNAFDKDMDSILSPAEIKDAFPRFNQLNMRHITNETGFADAKLIAQMLGNLGSLMWGHGPADDLLRIEDIVEASFALLDRNDDDALSMMELSILCGTEESFNLLDEDLDGLATVKEVTAMLSAYSKDSCVGLKLVKDISKGIKAAIPPVYKKCAWLVNVGGHYRVPLDPMSSLNRNARSLWKWQPPQMQGTSTAGTSTEAPPKRREAVEDSSDEGQARRLLSIHDGASSLSSSVPQRLLDVLPNTKVDKSGRRQTTTPGGTPVAPGSYNFTVTIFLDTQAVAWGVLIGQDTVLTSASGMALIPGDAYDQNRVTAVVGGVSNTLEEPGTHQSYVRAMMPHPSYRIQHTHDLAILALQHPAPFGAVEVYDGFDAGFDDCSKMQVIALGVGSSGELTERSVDIMRYNECGDRYFWHYGVAGTTGPDVMCVTGPIDNCDLSVKLGQALFTISPKGVPVLLGIKGSITECNSLPTAYVRVSEARDWMLSVITEAVFIPMKLHVTVKKISMPSGTLTVWAGPVEHEMASSIVLDSKCQAGAVTDDHGTGTFLIVYEPDVNMTKPCGADCIMQQGFEFEFGVETCESNFETNMKQPTFDSAQAQAACEMPGLDPSATGPTGIRGCRYEGMGRCMSPECKLTERWQALGPMETAGVAFAGGLGHRSVQNSTHEYGVWTCLRDWNATEQLNCGIRQNELGCFWFEEMGREWMFVGRNGEVRLVEKNKYFDGLHKEERHMVGSDILRAVPRAHANSHMMEPL